MKKNLQGNGWNYRIVEKDYENVPYYGIHEVYYDKDGKASSCTVSPIDPFGETVDELKECMTHMLLALSRPVLKYSEIVERGD